jgi:hypothetical protein
VDGPYCAVRFPSNGNSSSGKDPKDEEGGIMNENTRLLRKDDLQAVRSGAMPRLPDCFQTKPKKVVNTEPASVLALTVDGQGVHCVVRWAVLFIRFSESFLQLELLEQNYRGTWNYSRRENLRPDNLSKLPYHTVPV